MLLSWATSWLPTVTTLPFGMDNALTLGVGYFKTVADLFPPLAVLLEYVLIYIGFKLTLLVLNLFKIIRFEK